MTAQLRQTLSASEDRSQRLELLSSLSEQLSAILQMEPLLSEIVNQVKDTFAYYHVHIYLLDNAREELVVAEGTGLAGAEMKAKQHSIPLNAATSLVARAARTQEAVKVDNVREAEDWLPNKLLPDTAAELAVPIILEGQVVGVLDVQTDVLGGLGEDDAAVLRSVANQVAVALRNARLFAEVETSLAEARIAQEKYIVQGWDKTKIRQQNAAYLHQLNPNLPAPPEQALAKTKAVALQKDQAMVVSVNGNNSETDEGAQTEAIVASVNLSGKTIGVLQMLQGEQQAQSWTENDLSFVQAVLDQVAQSAENLRLFDETRERAGREQLITQISDKFRRAPDMETLMNMGVQEIARVLGPSRAFVRLGSEEEFIKANASIG